MKFFEQHELRYKDSSKMGCKWLEKGGDVLWEIITTCNCQAGSQQCITVALSDSPMTIG